MEWSLSSSKSSWSSGASSQSPLSLSLSPRMFLIILLTTTWTPRYKRGLEVTIMGQVGSLLNILAKQTEWLTLGTSCVVKGSYCQCHYCKCEKGQLHCAKKGFGGHKVLLWEEVLLWQHLSYLTAEFWEEVLLWQHGGRILPLWLLQARSCLSFQNYCL